MPLWFRILCALGLLATVWTTVEGLLRARQNLRNLRHPLFKERATSILVARMKAGREVDWVDLVLVMIAVADEMPITLLHILLMKPFIQGVADHAALRARLATAGRSHADDTVVQTLEQIAEENRSRPSPWSNFSHMFHYYIVRSCHVSCIVTPGQFAVAGTLFSAAWMIPIAATASGIGPALWGLVAGVFGFFKIGLSAGALDYGVRRGEDHSEELIHADIVQEALDPKVLDRAADRMYWVPSGGTYSR
jgi:hypothetical protein